KETGVDGKVTAYPLDTTGQIASVSWIQDAIGNYHTMSYSSGRLQTIKDAVGRLVSFSYNASNVLETIQDWAGRRVTMQYDTASVSGKPLLTTVIGLSGCQTVYRYSSTPLLTGIVDPNGYNTSYSYDAQTQKVT